MKGDVCKIDGCKKLVSGRTGRVCSMHLARFWRSGGDFNYISPNWNNLKKGTPCLSPLGYLRINIDGKRILHHRYVMEQHLGRKLRSKERIHHINGIKTDNRIKNLDLIANQAKHISKYHRKRTLVDWSKYDVPYHQKIKTCIIHGCNLKAETRGLCFKHMTSFYRNRFKKRNT